MIAVPSSNRKYEIHNEAAGIMIRQEGMQRVVEVTIPDSEGLMNLKGMTSPGMLGAVYEDIERGLGEFFGKASSKVMSLGTDGGGYISPTTLTFEYPMQGDAKSTNSLEAVVCETLAVIKQGITEGQQRYERLADFNCAPLPPEESPLVKAYQERLENSAKQAQTMQSQPPTTQSLGTPALTPTQRQQWVFGQDTQRTR